jgi:hypothetical protein
MINLLLIIDLYKTMVIYERLINVHSLISKIKIDKNSIKVYYFYIINAYFN